jgi:hypothetical protein
MEIWLVTDFSVVPVAQPNTGVRSKSTSRMNDRMRLQSLKSADYVCMRSNFLSSSGRTAIS